MTCDCPIFAKAKFIQWTWPGEDKFVVMFGGLHIEMTLWNMLGDYLADSGWTSSLIEALILIFIGAHREANFDLYIEALEDLVGFFFAFDHYNYAWWLPIHIWDMKSLPVCFQQEFKSNWVASKSNSRSVYKHNSIHCDCLYIICITGSPIFQEQVTCLVCAIENFGNPFEDSGSELFVLNSRICAHEFVVELSKL